MSRPASFTKLTAREIRALMPSPNDIEVLMIPGAARRDLYRAMQAHAPADLAECLNALDTTAARITRDQYFQISHAIEFPIHDWLKRNADVTARGRQERTQTALEANTKARAAVATLENLGYAWHPPSKKFMKVAPSWE